MNQGTQTNHRTGMEIAVIGMACRFPGARDIDEFWDNLKNGIESILSFSDEESEQFGENPGLTKNPNYVKAMGILGNSHWFDAPFFNYTPAEAELLDPQVRKFHEVTWAALENAGYEPGAFHEPIGLYAGASCNLYWEAAAVASGKNETLGGFQTFRLIDKDYLSTHISYKLNLKGPAVSVQTACSTSLVAIDQACRALLTGQCQMAVAGGVSIVSSPGRGYLYQEGMIGSADGHVRAFDTHASGTVAGEGAGAVALKLLEDAEIDGDYIYAVIKGTAINNDGNRKVGYAAPSIQGQVEVLRAARHMAEIIPESIAYIEAHGTGTTLGDPVEIEALKTAFNTQKTNYCAIGSVKTNLGHLDAAAGVAGFIKTVLALKHKQIPPSLHFESPNTGIDFENSPFYVNTTLKEWNTNGYPLRAGVSSFGIGGTNAHLILEEAGEESSGQTRGKVPTTGQSREYQLILLSAKTPTALEKMTENLANHFRENPGVNLADAAYTLQTGRKVFPCRRILACKNVKEATGKLMSPQSGKVRTFSAKEDKSTVIFMFPGLGPQYTNMGLDLYKKEPYFREKMDRCFEILDTLVDYNVKEVLYPGEVDNISNRSDKSYIPGINQTEIAQIVIFILEYALCKLLMKWGITPHALIGYSFGEYAAACISGVFSLEDALKLVTARGRLIGMLPAGTMLGVPLPVQEVKPLLNSQLSIAIDNGPSCIVAGPTVAVAAFEKRMKEKRYICFPMEAGHALHSHMMTPIRQEFEKELRQITGNEPQIPYISNVTADWFTADQAADPHYWSTHLVETVRFADGVETLLNLIEEEKTRGIWVEIGPGSDLSTLLKRSTENKPDHKVLNLLRSAKKTAEDNGYLLNRLGQLWLYGIEIDWPAYYDREKRYRVPLPSYPFEGREYRFAGNPFDMTKESLPGTTPPLALEKQPIDNWFYLPSWKPSPLPVSLPTDQDSVPTGWLVFTDRCGLGAQLVEQLQGEHPGVPVVTVKTGSSFEKKQENLYTINPFNSSDYERLADELAVAGIHCGRIIHLWAVTPGDRQETKTGGKTETWWPWLEECQETGFYSLVYLARTLGRHGPVKDVQINVVTTHMQEVYGEELLHPGKATLLSPVHIIPQEYPGIECRTIDILLPHPGKKFLQDQEQQVCRLIREFNTPISDRQIALRGSHRLVRKYEPVKIEPPPIPPPRLKERGVYLVTGGLGGIGLTLAKELAQQVKARLVLVGRSPFPPPDQWDQWLAFHPDDDPTGCKIRELQKIRELGGQVLVLPGDVSDPTAMKAVINRAEQYFGPINGVIHAALQVDGAVLHRLTPQMVENVFAAKVKGTMVLDGLLKNAPLDFFILFSSIAAVNMGFGFAVYAAASAFLDAFALYKTATDGIFTLSINWDVWQDVGGVVQMAEDYSRELGVSSQQTQIKNGILAAEGMEVFHRLLNSNVPRVVVSTLDLEKRLRASNTQKMEQISDETVIASKKDPRPQLDCEYTAPVNHTQQTLAHIWESLLGYEKVGIHDDFFELGGDSLKAIILLQTVQAKLDAEIGIKDFFDYSTIAGLEAFITGNGNEVLTGGVKYPQAAPDPGNLYEPFSLTDVQMAYLLGRSSHIELGGGSTHVYEEMPLKIQIRCLNDALDKVINRHPMLRAVIMDDGSQRILKGEKKYKIDVQDLRTMDSSKQKERIAAERARMSHAAFNPYRWPLFEIKAFQLTDQVAYLCIGRDPLVMDAGSSIIFYNELEAYYENPDLQLPELEFTFRDYMKALEELKASPAYEKDKEFWLGKVGEFPTAPVLPLKQDPSAIQTPTFSRKAKHFEKDWWSKFKEVAGKFNVTPAVLICTVYAEVLAYWSNEPRLAINLTVYNRYPFHPDVEKIIGDFTSLLLLDIYLKPGTTFREKARNLQNTLFEALEHRHYDGVEFIREIAKARNLVNKAVMPIVFTSALFGARDQAPAGNIEAEAKYIAQQWEWDDSTKKEEGVSQTSQVFLDNIVSDSGGGLSIAWDYVEDLFEPEVIDTMFQQNITLLEELVEGSGDIRIRVPENLTLFQQQYNDTEEETPTTTLPRLFKECVARTPDHIALEYERQQITYKELDEKALQAAAYLRQQGVASGSLVAVLTPRGIEPIINIIGVLKAGAAYVPIDDNYPLERRDYIFRSSNSKILVEPILYKAKHQETYPGNAGENSTHPGDIAYVIYTSGSTGKPKGVVITHQAAINTLLDINRRFRVEETDRVMGISSMCFDLSVYDVFGTFFAGARLVVIPTQKDVDILIDTMKEKNITIWNSVPAVMNLVVDNLEPGYINPYLKQVWLSGDWIPLNLPGKINRYFPGARVISMGGATEGSIWSIYYPVKEVENHWKSIPYGYPLANQAFYVLNHRMEPCPVRVPGELYIGGMGVARGYLGDQEKTRCAFILHPKLGRLYRTGDYGVFHKQGFIEFLGRKDHQVKIRGYRVELGEIETCLLEYDHVKNALVIDRVINNGKRYLAAYVTADPGTWPGQAALSAYLAKKLPDYMIPSYIIRLEILPLTANGKLDRKTLPEPGDDIEVIDNIAYAAPGSDVEKTMVEIFREILDLAPGQVGIDDNFLELGGDSLKAITLAAKIRKKLDIKIPLTEIFRTPTIRELALFISGVRVKHRYAAIESAAKKTYYTLSSAQKRLYFVYQMDPGSTGCNIQRVTLLEGKPEKIKFTRTFQKLIRRHESLCTSFHMIKNEPMQKIHLSVGFEVEYHSTGPLRQNIEWEKENQAPYAVSCASTIKNFIRPFDLTRAPLLRVGLIKIREERHLLILDMHHIISDGASLTILVRDFVDLYEGNQLPALRIHYKDFAEWQTSEKESMKQQEEYWLNQFNGEIPVLNLPLDYARPTLRSLEGSTVHFEIGRSETQALRKLAFQEGVTMYMLLLAIYVVLLSRITGQEDIILGTPVVGRRHVDLEPIIGMFVNALVLRNFPKPRKIFTQFLKEVKERTFRSFENQEYSFEELVEKVSANSGKTRDLSRFSLVDAGFGLEKKEEQQQRVLRSGKSILTVKSYPFESNVSQVDINLVGYEGEDRLSFGFQYCTKLFKRETIQQFTGYFKQILTAVTRDPGQQLKDIAVKPVPSKQAKEKQPPVKRRVKSLEVEFDI